MPAARDRVRRNLLLSLLLLDAPSASIMVKQRGTIVKSEPRAAEGTTRLTVPFQRNSGHLFEQ